MKIKFVRRRADAVAPKYSSEFAAGADLFACPDEDAVTVAPGECVMIPTGIAAEIPMGYVGLVCARSGMAVRKGLAPANKVGVIDCDYRGEIMVALFNHSREERTVEKGERIAQLLLVPYICGEFEEAESLSDTVRGEGGFGSTGK